MKRHEMYLLMTENFQTLLKLHEQAQKEYTLKDEAFDNFNRLAANLGLDRKLVLWVYMQKHLDGVMNFIRGHQMQREDVEGRINDCIVYLQILRGMIREDRMQPAQENAPIGQPMTATAQLKMAEKPQRRYSPEGNIPGYGWFRYNFEERHWDHKDRVDVPWMKIIVDYKFLPKDIADALEGLKYYGGEKEEGINPS